MVSNYVLESSSLRQWAKDYQDLVRVTTAQELYGLPTAGGSNDCPFDTNVTGCLIYILVLQDFKAHPEGSPSSNALPEVMWSGELHGNERVGPTAVLEAAGLLLQAAECESYPLQSTATSTSHKPASSKWETLLDLLLSFRRENVLAEELETAQNCRKVLSNGGINNHVRKWLARLVSTRRIIIVPTANALGYYQNVRREEDIDPNRDFPYNILSSNSDQCMQSIAARTLNEIYRDHMIQMSLTFHGGMEAIAYEWGATSWGYSTLSPDDKGQYDVSAAFSRIAGGFGTTPVYEYGDMNSLVYPVQGGYEDYAYAGSWDTERMIQCEPTTHGGYSTEKTTYSDWTLRAFNILLETSDMINPFQSTLGTSEDIMNPNSAGNGHVARNM